MTFEARRFAASMPVWLFATGYFALNALTRGLTSSTADLDQAEQLVLSQDLSWGYGTQPPLYTWLVHILFGLTGGPSIWGLLAFKAALLSALVLGALKMGGEMGFDRPRQILTVAGLALIPQIIWEAQRDLTHSVLATVFAAWTLWSFLSLHRSPTVARYVLFGALAGIGLLGKYNFVFFLVALLLAGLSTPGYRRHLLTYRILISFAITLVILLPHLIWLLTHAEVALSSSRKLEIDQSFSLGGVGAVLMALLAFTGPLLLAYGLSWKRSGGVAPIAGIHRELLTRLLLVLTLMLVIFMLASGASHLKDRWLQPLYFFLPVLFVAMGIGRIRVYLGFAAAMMLAAAVMLPGRTLTAKWTEHVSRPNLPYEYLGQELRGKIGVPDVVISNRELLAGNMRLIFPESRVEVARTSAELQQKLADHAGRKLLFMTDIVGRKDSGVPLKGVEILQDRSFSFLEHDLLHVPGTKHRVYWLEI